MNKNTYIILVVAIILLLIGGWWYFAMPSKNTNTQPTVASETSQLTVLDNSVQIKELTEASFKNIASQTVEAHEGAHVKTSLTGRAVIESPNQTTTAVDKNSEFTITTQQENKTLINLAFGNMWATVQKVFGQGEYYQVQTPNAVITVRGTSFGVFYNGAITTVMVTKSKVWLLSIDPITKKPIGSEITINENFKGVVKNGQEPVVSPISTTDKKLDWYAFNNPVISKPKTTNSTPPIIQAPPPIITAPPASIACSTNIQCGANLVSGGPFCVQNSVYQKYIIYTCNNPGLASAYCSSSIATNLVNDCTTNQACRSGQCVDIQPPKTGQ